MGKPEVVEIDGKYVVKYEIGLDSNADGQNSLSLSVQIAADKSEVMEEVIAKAVASGKLPDWLKGVLGIK